MSNNFSGWESFRNAEDSTKANFPTDFQKGFSWLSYFDVKEEEKEFFSKHAIKFILYVCLVTIGVKE